MAVTQQDVDALNAAIATGERSVVLNGQSVTYRSVTELIKAREDLKLQMEHEALALQGRKRGGLYYVTSAGRGY